MVIFADGQAHDAAVMFEEAKLLKSMGVKILSVGYGHNLTKNSFGMKNLMKMATNHKDMFSIDFKNNDLVLEEKIEVITKHLVEVDCPRAFARKCVVFLRMGLCVIHVNFLFRVVNTRIPLLYMLDLVETFDDLKQRTLMLKTVHVFEHRIYFF